MHPKLDLILAFVLSLHFLNTPPWNPLLFLKSQKNWRCLNVLWLSEFHWLSSDVSKMEPNTWLFTFAGIECFIILLFLVLIFVLVTFGGRPKYFPQHQSTTILINRILVIFTGKSDSAHPQEKFWTLVFTTKHDELRESSSGGAPILQLSPPDEFKIQYGSGFIRSHLPSSIPIWIMTFFPEDSVIFQTKKYMFYFYFGTVLFRTANIALTAGYLRSITSSLHKLHS